MPYKLGFYNTVTGDFTGFLDGKTYRTLKEAKVELEDALSSLSMGAEMFRCAGYDPDEDISIDIFKY